MKWKEEEEKSRRISRSDAKLRVKIKNEFYFKCDSPSNDWPYVCIINYVMYCCWLVTSGGLMC